MSGKVGESFITEAINSFPPIKAMREARKEMKILKLKKETPANEPAKVPPLEDFPVPEPERIQSGQDYAQVASRTKTYDGGGSHRPPHIMQEEDMPEPQQRQQQHRQEEVEEVEVTVEELIMDMHRRVVDILNNQILLARDISSLYGKVSMVEDRLNRMTVIKR